MVILLWASWFLLVVSCSGQLISPCPKIFQYEQRPNEPDRWYGTATLMTDQELSGVWFRILLDAPSIQLGNWFGEVKSRDDSYGYLIKNPNYQLKPNTPLKIKFFIRYDQNKPLPKLVNLKLNGVLKCPESTLSTELPTGGTLFTSPLQPEGPLPQNFQGEGGLTPSIVVEQSISRPGATSESQDIYKGDFIELLKPHSQSIQKPTNSKPTIFDAAICGTVVTSPKPLVTHGQATQEGEFPWHAALYYSQGIDLTYVCGASLISLTHLLSVAHCVTLKKSQTVINSDNLAVFLGKFYLRTWKSPGLQNRHVDKIFVHSKYNPQSFGNDIAVLKLTEPAHLSDYVRPVCLWEGPSSLELVVNQVGTVAGWGFDETGKVTEQLTKAHMPIVSQETCLFSYPDFYSRFTSSTTMCAGYQNGTSVCNGDSGGGLVLTKPGSDKNNPVYQIRGLVSISVAVQNKFSCDSRHFVVFTDVAKFLDFVKAAMKQ
ncbi:chymotrypsin-C-like [Euwallacea fornicatus]|uniref:chymotrypsin-C-like n=1 Tax=Euwallacea fornicatus TaxID=995702 RepID=UPI00338E7949